MVSIYYDLWAGNFHWNFEDVAKSIVCMMMSGPFLTGYTQVVFFSYLYKVLPAAIGWEYLTDISITLNYWVVNFLDSE